MTSQKKQATQPQPTFAAITSLALAKGALAAALDKKALEPVLLDVRKLASYTDYLLVVSGTSERHVAAISEGVMETLRQQGLRPLGTEGKAGKKD